MIKLNDKIAVISNGPLNEGLTMMIASQRLKTEGRKNTTTFSNCLKDISSWFCIHDFEQIPKIQNIKETFKDFNCVILFYRDDPFCKTCIEVLRAKNSATSLYIFYPNAPMQHQKIEPQDIFFNKTLSMVDNIVTIISNILSTQHHSKSNGLSPPLTLNLTHRKFAKRVLIEKDKYTQKKLTCIENILTSLDFEPYILQKSNSKEILSLIYESGYYIGSSDTDTSTLASNLYIPSLLLKKNTPPKLRHAGWLNQTIITPPFWLKHLALPFTKRVLYAFKRLVINHHELIS